MKARFSLGLRTMPQFSFSSRNIGVQTFVCGCCFKSPKTVLPNLAFGPSRGRFQAILRHPFQALIRFNRMLEQTHQSLKDLSTISVDRTIKIPFNQNTDYYKLTLESSVMAPSVSRRPQTISSLVIVVNPDNGIG
uniref:Uncharacterized protein n=1 Tax=Glossina brevipalpis TaxID=37001 RepID=A0A1A9W6R0_9MUSC